MLDGHNGALVRRFILFVIVIRSSEKIKVYNKKISINYVSKGENRTNMVKM